MQPALAVKDENARRLAFPDKFKKVFHDAHIYQKSQAKKIAIMSLFREMAPVTDRMKIPTFEGFTSFRKTDKYW
jgi:hypothetical protein